MNKDSIVSAFNRVGLSLEKHSPEILTGIGIAGMLATTVLAVKATPKALKKIEEKKQSSDGTITKVEAAKCAWKCYIPSIVTGALSIACIIGATKLSLGRNAALATACTLSEKALEEYQEKAVEVIGEQKEQEIRHAVAEKQVKDIPLGTGEVIDTGEGTQLFCDPLSGRQFLSSTTYIDKCVNKLNQRLLTDGEVFLNDLYYELGLKPIDGRIGDVLHWEADRGLIDIRIEWVLEPPDETGVRCGVLSYKNAPRYM